MGASGQATTGYWLAALIGAVLLLTFIVSMTTAVVRRRLRHHRHAAPEPAVRSFGEPPSDADVPAARCRGLIAEAFIVPERMSGQIDTGTYQARMNDLAQEARREGRARNAG
jgi:hypothetical protein